MKSRCLAITAALLLAATGLTQRGDLRPVANVTQLMQAMVIPASNALFDLPRKPPESEQEWSEARNSAVILAESGNLLLIGRRAMRSDVWVSTSQALTEAGKAALEATLEKDVESITEIGNQIIEACETCHEKHWIR